MVVVLPSGTVTFAFVDVVGSTAAFTDHGEAFVTAVDRLHQAISDCTYAHDGVVVKTEGDGAFLAFGTADSAVRALVALQAHVEAVAKATATPGPRLRVRAGAHTGAAMPVAGDYVALPVNIAARVTSAAGAGQVLVSSSVVEALADAALVDIAGDPVGEYALKDVRGPMPLHRVAGGAEPPRASPYQRTNVAIPMTSFVGRTAEVAELQELVGAHRLVTVVGPGGMGKTRITSQLLLDIADSYDAGAWLVELASITMSEQVPAQVAAAVGSTATAIDDLVAELAARGPILLLMDNCEHVIDAAADAAAQLIARVPTLRVLATSRESLQVEGEVVWRIPSLSDHDTLCDLFEQRLRTATAGRAPTPDRTQISLLCAELDGSPLAIELAAVHALDVPITDLIAMVRDGTDPLARRGSDRQSSLDTVVAWSMDRLDTAHREALLVLSLAPGRLTAEEAGLLLRDLAAQHHTTTAALLRSLVRVSLLDLDGHRYRLLDTIRAAARRALHANADLHAQARAMLHAAAAAMVDVDRDFSLIQGDDPQADRLLLLEEALLDAWRDRIPGLGEVWATLGAAGIWLPLSQRLHNAALEVLDETPRADSIGADDAYRVAGAFNVVDNCGPAPISWEFERITQHAAAVAAGSPPVVASRAVLAIALHLLGTCSRPDQAVPLVRLGAVLAEESGEANQQVGAAVVEGLLAHALGEKEEVVRHTERARALVPRNSVDHSVVINNYADALNGVGRRREALEQLRRELDRRPLRRDRWWLTTTLAEVLKDSGARQDGLLIARQLRDELALEPQDGPAGPIMRRTVEVFPELEAET